MKIATNVIGYIAAIALSFMLGCSSVERNEVNEPQQLYAAGDVLFNSAEENISVVVVDLEFMSTLVEDFDHDDAVIIYPLYDEATGHLSVYVLEGYVGVGIARMLQSNTSLRQHNNWLKEMLDLASNPTPGL